MRIGNDMLGLKHNPSKRPRHVVEPGRVVEGVTIIIDILL